MFVVIFIPRPIGRPRPHLVHVKIFDDPFGAHGPNDAVEAGDGLAQAREPNQSVRMHLQLFRSEDHRGDENAAEHGDEGQRDQGEVNYR